MNYDLLIDNYVFDNVLLNNNYLLYLEHYNNREFNINNFFVNVAINISQLLNLGSSS